MAVYNVKTLKQGKYSPVNRKKYVGKNIDKIIYRSGLELKLMKIVDNSESILEWSSEEVIIPYIKPTTGRIHKYFMDFFIKKKLPDGTIKDYLVEVKPFDMLRPPKVPKRKTKRYFELIEAYSVNSAKWEAAKIFAEKNNMVFTIMTEKSLK